MKRRRLHNGFTLLELAIAMSMSAILMGAVLAFLIPGMNVFESLIAGNDQQSNLTGVMQSIVQDAAGMSALYVDNTQCYVACMADTASAHRLYYYWDPHGTGNIKTLYRKFESTSNSIACSGGSVFARNLNVAQTSFAMSNALTKSAMNVSLAGVGENGTQVANSLFKISSSIFPTTQERNIIFSEGFECNTLRAGWDIHPGANSSWSITASSHQGIYEITDTSQSSSLSTTTIEVPIDLARTSAAHLKFNYMNDGTISSGDQFTAYYFDGTTYQVIFTDISGTMVLSPKTIESDLTGYTFADNGTIKFSATLSHAGAHWYVDGISVFTP